MTFRSVLNRYYLLRLLPIFAFLFIFVLITRMGDSGLHGFIYGFIKWGTWHSLTVRFVSIALAGLVFSSSRNRTMIATLQSHPISRSSIFFARYLLLLFLVFLTQLFVFFSALVYFALGLNSRVTLVMALSEGPEYVGSAILSSIVASAVVGIWTASLYSSSAIVFKKSQIGYVLNFILFAGYESIVKNHLIIPWDDYYIYGIIATIRNIMVQMNGYFATVTKYDLEANFWIVFTLDDLVIQLQVLAIFVLVGTILAWLIFCVRSRTW